jgi:hypothetical protein
VPCHRVIAAAGRLGGYGGSEALKRSTELQRKIREASPFREARQRYEDLSATTLIEALHGMRPIPDGYLRAKQEFEKFLLDAENAGDGLIEEFAEARRDFDDSIAQWQQKNGDRSAFVDVLDEKRRNYEQRAIDLEFEKARATLAQGEHAELINEFRVVLILRRSQNPL